MGISEPRFQRLVMDLEGVLWRAIQDDELDAEFAAAACESALEGLDFEETDDAGKCASGVARLNR